ncbi:MFS transporter [Niveibacterium sp. SC-1]|uniref:MFS transporter n=1 Tax=Niveibacterium sp. SC-1 TaxID=3135646 RepID=UPI00311E75E5
MSLSDAQTRTTLRLVFLILLLDVMGISILWPVVAFIVREYSDSAIMLTLLTALYSAAQFFAAPAMGRFGDRWGRRPVLIASLVGSAVGYVLFGLGGALWVLMLSRLIDGITAGNQSVAAAVIADVSTRETRAKNFTLFGMAWGLGIIIGPALGAALGQWHLAAPAYLAGALSALAAIISLRVLPETLSEAHRDTRPLRWADLNPFTAIFELMRRPLLGRVLLVLCLFNFVFNGYNSTEGLYLLDRFHVQPWQIGTLLALAGFALASLQRVVPPLNARFGGRRVAIFAFFALAVCALATWLTPVFGGLYVVVTLRTAAAGLIFPTLGALMSSQVQPREQGVLMGVNAALTSAMTIFGPLWAGAVYDRVMPGAPYWMGAILLALTALVLIGLREPAARPSGPPAA